MSNTWPRLSIKDVCESIVDCVNKTAPTVEGPTPYKMIRTTNVKSGWIDISTVKYVEEEVYKKWTRRIKPRKGDVILTREAPLGEVGMLRVNDNVFLGQRLVQYRANSNKLDNRFLLYSFLANDLQGQIKSLGSGATVEHMRVPDAEKLTLRVPSLETQRKIASILSAYDDLIENNTRRIKILEEMAQMIYREWFVKFRFPGHEKVKMVDVPVETLHATSLQKMPEGWEVKKLGEVCSLIKRGISPKYDDNSDQIVINQKCIRNFRLSLKESRKHNSKVPAEKNVVQGDVLINSTGVGTLGRVAQVLQNIRDCTVDSHVTIVRRSAALDADFLGLQLFELQGHFESLGQGATGQTELGREAIANTDFLLAPRELQDKFATIVKPIRELTIKLLEKNDNLRQTRDLLLPKLISGTVDVEGFDININVET